MRFLEGLDCARPWRRPGIALLFLVVVFPLASQGQGFPGDPPPVEEKCVTYHLWTWFFFSIDSTTGSVSQQLACEPVPLGVIADHWVALDQHCGACDESNRWIEMQTNIRYEWQILGADAGCLSAIGNDESQCGPLLTGQQVLYHAPELEDGEEEVVLILVKAINDDLPGKPLPEEAAGFFTITISHSVVEDSVSVGEHLVKRTRGLNSYAIDFEAFNNENDPGVEAVATGCFAQWSWWEGSDITGDFEVGAEGSPLSEILYEDLVTLRVIDQGDTDDLEMWCDPVFGSDCSKSAIKTITLPDTLFYEWSADKGSFPLGTFGREVIYQAPDEEGDVTITLTIFNGGLQYDDDDLEIEKTFPIVREKSELTGMAIGWINGASVVPPQPEATPPNGAPGFKFQTPYFHQWIIPAAATKYWFARETPALLPEQWVYNYELPGPSLKKLNLHPWYHAVKGVDSSANPPPLTTFPDLNAVRDWMTGQQYRVVHAIMATGTERRDVIKDVPLDDIEDFDLIRDHGWTPMNQGFWLDTHMAHVMTGWEWDDFEEGMSQNPEITLSGECSEEVKITLQHEYRVGPKGNQISALMTNRFAPWITGNLELTLKAGEDATPGDVLNTASPAYPTYYVLYGTDGSISSFATQAQMNTTSFIDFGEPLVPPPLGL